MISKYSHIYFIGIGGIGMSALAQYFFHEGKVIGGYDKTQTDITKSLEKMGMVLNYEESKTAIPNRFLNQDNVLIIYTPAIKRGNQQLDYFFENGFRVIKRSQALGEITQNTFCFAVAGTHGKTTTSSILAHLLYECNIPVSAFLGGVTVNYSSNYFSNGTEVSVVEADEFDRSFLTLNPDYACITSMDADHLDIYGEKSELELSFKDFAGKVPENGKLFVRSGLPLSGITYGVDDSSIYSSENIRIEEGGYVFDLRMPHSVIKDIKFNLPGRHNVSNATVALAMAAEYGCPPEQLAKALASYKGVVRRFNYRIKTDELVVIDDYAHHPTEIKAVLEALKEFYPGKKNLVVFQPHLYSRTRDFGDEFALVLSCFDEVILLDIYPARELPIEGITSEWLLEKISIENKSLVSKDNLLNKIKSSDASVIALLGAGDIGEEVSRIVNGLKVEN